MGKLIDSDKLLAELNARSTNPNYRLNMHVIKAMIKRQPDALEQELVLGKITEIIEPLRHLPIGEMSDIEWDILRVIDKHMGEKGVEK